MTSEEQDAAMPPDAAPDLCPHGNFWGECEECDHQNEEEDLETYLSADRNEIERLKALCQRAANALQLWDGYVSLNQGIPREFWAEQMPALAKELREAAK